MYAHDTDRHPDFEWPRLSLRGLVERLAAADERCTAREHALENLDPHLLRDIGMTPSPTSRVSCAGCGARLVSVAARRRRVRARPDRWPRHPRRPPARSDGCRRAASARVRRRDRGPRRCRRGTTDRGSRRASRRDRRTIASNARWYSCAVVRAAPAGRPAAPAGPCASIAASIAVEVARGHRRVDPAQQVVAAERHDHRVDVVGRASSRCARARPRWCRPRRRR